MIRSESIKNLSIALSKFQQSIKNPVSSKRVDVETRSGKNGKNYEFTYAPLSEILAVVRPLLGEHGLAIMQIPTTNNNMVSVVTVLTHSSGEWIEFPEITLRIEGPGAQPIGSAITYLRRYSLSSVLGLASEEDDNGKAADEKPSKSNPSNKNNKKPTPKVKQALITTDQAKGLFTSADQDLVRKVINSFGYEKSTDIEVKNYKAIVDKIHQEKRNESEKKNKADNNK